MKLWVKIGMGLLGGGAVGTGGYFLWKYLKKKNDGDVALEVEYISDCKGFSDAVDKAIKEDPRSKEPVMRDDDDQKKGEMDIDKERFAKAVKNYIPGSEEQQNFETYLAEMESPEEDEDDDYDDDDWEEDPRKDNDGPYVITAGEFCNTRSYYDKVSLNYFRKDDVVSDDKDQVFENVEGLLGDLQEELMENDYPANLYIRNPELEIDYEISVVDGSYRKEVLHLDEEG